MRHQITITYNHFYITKYTVVAQVGVIFGRGGGLEGDLQKVQPTIKKFLLKCPFSYDVINISKKLDQIK